MLIEDIGEVFKVAVRVNIVVFAVDRCAGEAGGIAFKHLLIRGNFEGIVTLCAEISVHGDGKEVVLIGFLNLVETYNAARAPATFRAGPLFDNVHSLHTAVKSNNRNRSHVVFCSCIIAAVHLSYSKRTFVHTLAVGLNFRNSHALCAEVAERSGEVYRTAGCVAVYFVSIVERSDVRHTIVAHVSAELLVAAGKFAAKTVCAKQGEVVVLTAGFTVGVALNEVGSVAVFVEPSRGVVPTAIVEISTAINRSGINARCYRVVLVRRRLNVSRVTYHDAVTRDGVRILTSDNVSFKFIKAASLLPYNLTRLQAHHPNRAVGERTRSSVESNLVDGVANILLH